MDQHKFCQSCSMPLDGSELLGTEKDGSKNQEYCRFCYSNGEFTHPGITLDQMKSHMIGFMEEEKLPPDILEEAISRLPKLKRWTAKVKERLCEKN